jgi:hypothetical protein
LIEPLRTSPIKLDPSNLNAVAETLSQFASTSSGRKFVLLGEANYIDSNLQIHAQNETIETITKLLLKSISKSEKRILPRKVLQGYIFFLRQLYRTSQGLLAISKFKLHFHFANLFNSLGEEEKKSEWGVCLIDNLLNYGATPAGVLILNESGFIETCVALMFSRYKKKLKVSEYEKFGYGTLVSQISATRPGMTALCKTGWIDSCVNELWGFLECDQPFGPHVLDIDSLVVSKSISNLLKLVSTFPGLTACLEMEESRDSRGTFTDLLKSMALVQFSKKSLLMTFEDTHQVGLRILKHLVASLDSSILLQVKFRYINYLVNELNDYYICTRTY